jgi:acetyl esterase/lipase
MRKSVPHNPHRTSRIARDFVFYTKSILIMKLSLLLSTILLITSCQKNPENSSNSSMKTILNVSYGNDVRHKMDVYLPANRNTTDTRTIILIHGGAWMSGDKSDFTAFVDTLKNRVPEYAIINLNYRLASMAGNFFPSQENDIKQAFEFILSKSEEYGISKKTVLLGASAGGHLALLQGYKNAPAGTVEAVVDFFGPADMVTLHDNATDPTLVPMLQTLMGGTPAANPSLYASSSPANFVAATTPPTIILQGGMDELVDVSQAELLKAKLANHGVVHEYVFYPTEGHGWFGQALSHSFDRIQEFLAEVVD